jgi:hypothetical protein
MINAASFWKTIFANILSPSPFSFLEATYKNNVSVMINNFSSNNVSTSNLLSSL